MQCFNFYEHKWLLVQAKTGILMMNMGGPRNSEEVQGFLNNLFADRDIIKLPFQVTLAIGVSSPQMVNIY